MQSIQAFPQFVKGFCLNKNNNMGCSIVPRTRQKNRPRFFQYQFHQ